MPVDVEYGAQPLISIDGRRLSRPVELRIEEVDVHDHLHLPDMVEVRFRDDQRTVLGDAGAVIGKEVEVAATRVGGESSERPLFRGEITALELEYDAASGTHTVLRGYDKAHRLMKQRHTRAWIETDLATLVRTLGQEAGLQVQAEGRLRYEYMAQVNETDWDFLHRLARETGYEVSTGMGSLHLRLPPDAAEAPREGDVRQEAQPLQVVLGTNLRALRVRVTAAAQVEEVTVRAWDWANKREMIGRAPATTGTVDVRDDPQALARSFSSSPALSCHRPLGSQAQVDAAARSLAELIAASSAEAFGTVDGNPAIKAGEAISIASTGERFDGKYVVTASRHVFDEEGFRTHFEISGRQVRSVLGLTGDRDEANSHIDGVVVGIVTNNNDPDQHCRVKLKFPWLSGELESSWARVATLDAGADSRGAVFLPEVNDEVLVAFEHGDFRRPYVVGRLFNGIDVAPTAGLVEGGRVNHREYRSRLGHRVRFSDKQGDSHIEVATADGKRSIKLDETNRTLVVTVDRSTIEITDAGDITIDAAANITMKAAANLKLEATGTLEVKAPTVKVEGTGQTEVKGGVLRLN